MSFKKLLPILLVIVLVICKCSSALYNPTTADAQNSGTSLDSLIAGRKTYIESCSSCHSLYLPEQYTKREWIIIMDSMQTKSNLTEEQKKIILKYLVTKSKS